MALSASELQDQARSEVPAQAFTNTSIGNLIGKCCSTGRPITIPRYTTLNEHHNILAEESIGLKNSRDFYLKYFGIGVRGSQRVGTDSRGVDIVKVNQHQPIDANLFVPVPFIARPLSNPLSNLEREQFRLRTVEERNGELHEFYWWKLIDFANYNPEELKITRDPITGLEDSNPYVHRKDDLDDPQPVDFVSDGSTPVSNTYLNSTALLGCSLDKTMLREIALASKIYFGDASYSSINEVGVGWGIDVQFQGAIAGGGTMTYTEVASAVYAHYMTERDGRNAITNEKVNLNFDHGASAPMLLHTNATAGSTD